MRAPPRRAVPAVLAAACSARVAAAALPPVCAIDAATGYCVVAGPLPCPANPFRPGAAWGCSIIDLRVDVRPGEAPQQGLFVRFLVPARAPAAAAPALAAFPGTGECFLDVPAADAGVACACPAGVSCRAADGCKLFQVAQDGVVVVQFAERGTSHCYAADDPMQRTATWIGATEFEDFDHVLGRAASGGLHPRIPRVDVSRLGTTGSSHGGIEALLYATRSRRFRFAMAAPEVGTPSLWETWARWTFDPDVGAGDPGPAGLVAVAGGTPQMRAYPQSTYTQVFTDAERTGNWSGVAAFMRERTAYDADGGLATFHRQVGALYMHTGGRDCIVPGYGPVAFWEQLRCGWGRARPHDAWVYDNDPHSCDETSPTAFPTMAEQLDAGGYFPQWTSLLRNRTDVVWSGVLVAAARERLLGWHTAGAVPRPALVTPAAHDAADYRIVDTLAAVANANVTFFLAAGGALAAAPPQRPGALPGYTTAPGAARACPKYDLADPCGVDWGSAAEARQVLGQLMAGHGHYSAVLGVDVVLAGEAELRTRVRVTGAPPVGIVAALFVSPRGAPEGYRGYMVTQGVTSLARVAADGTRDVAVRLDARMLHLARGARVHLVLSAVSPGMVHNMPWVHPLTTPHNVSVLTGPAAPARLTLPVATAPAYAALPRANVSALLRGYWTW